MAETQEDVEVKQDLRLIEMADNVCTNLNFHALVGPCHRLVSFL